MDCSSIASLTKLGKSSSTPAKLSPSPASPAGFSSPLPVSAESPLSGVVRGSEARSESERRPLRRVEEEVGRLSGAALRRREGSMYLSMKVDVAVEKTMVSTPASGSTPVFLMVLCSWVRKQMRYSGMRIKEAEMIWEGRRRGEKGTAKTNSRDGAVFLMIA